MRPFLFLFPANAQIISSATALAFDLYKYTKFIRV